MIFIFSSRLTISRFQSTGLSLGLSPQSGSRKTRSLIMIFTGFPAVVLAAPYLDAGTRLGSGPNPFRTVASPSSATAPFCAPRYADCTALAAMLDRLLIFSARAPSSACSLLAKATGFLTKTSHN